MAYLVVDPEGRTQVFKLAERTGIGRDRENQIQLDDLRVSRFHCRISRTTSGLYKVTDLASAGGTRVNGKRIGEALLRTGDRLRLGSSELVFCHSRIETSRRMSLSSGLAVEATPPAAVEETVPPGPIPVELERAEERLDRLLGEFGQHGPLGLRRAERLLEEACRRSGAEPEASALRAQRNRLLELMEINRALTTELDLSRLLEMILDHLVHLTGAEQAFLLMFEGDRIRVECYRNASGARLARPELEVSRTIVERVRETGEPIYTHDAAGDSELAGFDSITNLKLRSILCLPLRFDRDGVGGALYVENRVRRQAFGNEDVELIEAFGDQASIALRNARQRERILLQNRNLAALHEVSRAVASTLDLDELMRALVDKLFEVTAAIRIAMLLPDGEGNLAYRLGRLRDGGELPECDVAPLTDLVKEALRQRDAAGPHAIVVPLIARTNKHLGVLYAEGPEDGFGPGEAELAQQIADTAALALSNARLYQRATIDSLTGLYKRDYFDARLHEEVLRTERYLGPLSLAMADLDHFKRLNDTYGHLVGDEALRLVGRLLREAVRETDIAARYGGEELAVIMPQTTVDQAFQVGERIRLAIEQQVSFPYPLSISVGVAAWSPGQSEAALIDRADRALYAAKSGGRNRVEVAPDAPAETPSPD